MKPRSSDGQILLHRLARNAANNMKPELEAQRVDPIGKGLEPRSTRCRGKSIIRHQVSAGGIHHKSLRGALLSRLPQIPPFIDHHILPSQRLQVPMQPEDIRFVLSLSDSQPIRIPAIPPHRRGGRELCRGNTTQSAQYNRYSQDSVNHWVKIPPERRASQSRRISL